MPEFKTLLEELAALDNESEAADEIRERMDPVWRRLAEDEKVEARHHSARLYEQEKEVME